LLGIKQPRDSTDRRDERNWREFPAWSGIVRDQFLLLGLTAAALLIHGYHYGIEDQAVYLPAIKKLLNPALYPFDANFFFLYVRWTLFHSAVATSVRLTHLPVDWAVFLWHVVSIYLLLLGCLRLARRCFAEPIYQWAGVALVAALLTLPVAGTALFIADQHLHPRALATAFLLFAMVAVMERRPIALLWIFLAALSHPSMAVYGFFHIAILAWGQSLAAPAFLLPKIPMSAPTNPIWREIMSHRNFQYPLRWAWYEWLGAIGPLIILYYFARIGRRNQMLDFERVCRCLAVSTSLGILAAVLFTQFFPAQTWVRFEPMRILHFTYVIFVLFSGSLLGKYVLRRKPLRWVLLFVPLAGAMFYCQRLEFPASRHIEWPGLASNNDWVQAFDWVRLHTPRGALFALDPQYMARPGEDFHGFRAISERSMLADTRKDPSVVEVFPDLAYQWKLETSDRLHWTQFDLAGFHRLKIIHGVTWVVLERPAAPGLSCPYSNRSITVCQID
jgi:hypothetical protein